MTDPAFKTRFAPSPTGLLHLGNVRTALFNYLLAAGRGGVFLLRLEDTDAARGEEKYEQALQHDLRWLSLDWQEGPGCERGHGPYAQTERGEIYRDYFSLLQEQGLAYPCFCSEHELKLERKAQRAARRAPRYSGRCRALSHEQVQERFAAGTPATLRFHVPDNVAIEFEDRVRGPQRFASDDIGDFVIRRSDGTPAFFFSNAVDDALMGVTLVVRGEDHLTNTPRQILLLRALGLPVSEYAHIALVVGADGAPLSKRHGSRTVQELREEGFLPIAIVNYLARLGHTYVDNTLMALGRLAAEFDMARLHRAPARFDRAQLLHWQKEAVARATDEELWAWLCRHHYPDGQATAALVPPDRALGFVQAVRDNIIMPGDARQWAAVLFSDNPPVENEAAALVRATGAVFFETALACLERGGDDFKAYAGAVGAATGAKGKSLFMPLRAVLTGATHGPEMGRLWTLLGPARVRRRLEQAVQHLAS